MEYRAGSDALLDPNANATDKYTYRAFGLATHVSGSSTTPNNFVGQKGYARDLELNLYFVRARYYDSVVGRWVSEDPIGEKGGDPNLYRYLRNNPTVATDPSGRVLLATDENSAKYVVSVLRELVPSAKFGKAPGGRYVIYGNQDEVVAARTKAADGNWVLQTFTERINGWDSLEVSTSGDRFPFNYLENPATELSNAEKRIANRARGNDIEWIVPQYSADDEPITVGYWDVLSGVGNLVSSPSCSNTLASRTLVAVG